MSKLLYIEASPREERSYSKAVAEAFIEAYTKNHPKDKVKRINLFKMRLPSFDGEALNAKYAILNGKPHTPEQKAAWGQVEKVIEQFKSADKYLLSTPMWNFGIPYKLKHYIDVITQPTYTFSYSPTEGYKGLVTGKPMAVVYARGGKYVPGTPEEAYDLQKKYVELALGFIGFTGVKSLIVEGTLYGPEVANASRDAAIAEARIAAEKF